jgi:hypothetical protein
MSTGIAKPKIPTFNDLVNLEGSIEKENELQVLLNMSPPEKWIKKNDMANGSMYMPIDKVEFLLTKVFIKWWVEVKSYSVMANSAAVCVRLYYVSPITLETLFQDGLGASPLQTEKGASATDFSKIRNAAVQMALPAAETFAIKDAAEKIGRIFGRDLNRKEVENYQNLSGRFDNSKDIKAAVNLMLSATDRDEAKKYFESFPKHVKESELVINELNKF